ncbi:alpha/beta hydrolase [Xylophilus sp. GOD-11R]|uniref:alpha/beta hydrolase n=1 Tax=Xylophilus sp. GOD-11R TaxID=3089814 RepID=UPI00298D34EC|nr:alpha/beta hydrolase [Xylophilus sp. GOD-11R]WPB54975.1 alpha/beta hydrolase [Xylophilus sp. GOD-11R]
MLSALIRDAEADYNLRARHPEREAVYADYAARSQRLRQALPPLSLRYASAPRCTIDWFAPPVTAQGPMPLLAFFHGGFWRGGDKTMFGFIAEPFLQAGVAVALVGYELAPAVSITDIVRQATQAMRYLFEQRAELGFDAARVSVSGHSAGGHLAAVLGSLDAEALDGYAIAGVVGLSGLYALQPFLLSSVNLEARMTLDEAELLSPASYGRFGAQRFMLAVGAEETDGFRQQTAYFSRHLDAIGQGHDVMVCPGRTHFDIFEDFVSPEAPLFRRALALVSA